MFIQINPSDNIQSEDGSPAQEVRMRKKQNKKLDFSKSFGQ